MNEDSEDSESADTDRTQGQAVGGRAFCPVSMADVFTSSSSSGRKDRTNGTQLEDASEEEDLDGDPATGPPMEDASEEENSEDNEDLEDDEGSRDEDETQGKKGDSDDDERAKFAHHILCKKNSEKKKLKHFTAST